MPLQVNNRQRGGLEVSPASGWVLGLGRRCWEEAAGPARLLVTPQLPHPVQSAVQGATPSCVVGFMMQGLAFSCTCRLSVGKPSEMLDGVPRKEGGFSMCMQGDLGQGVDFVCLFGFLVSFVFGVFFKSIE